MASETEMMMRADMASTIYVPISGKQGEGLVTKVDHEDYVRLWLSVTSVNSLLGYAVFRDGDTMMRLHRIVMDAPPDMVVDHINHDCLDNRKCNLRICTRKENMRNRRGADRDSKTGVLGVRQAGKKYQAQIRIDGLTKHLGTFKTIEEARAARIAGEQLYFGEFAPTPV